MEDRLVRTLLLLLVAFATQAAAIEDPTPAAAAARVNEPFKREALDVDRWVEQFEGERREVFAARSAILAALELRPGEDVADIGAGTGLFVNLFARTVGPDGVVYANDIAPAFVAFIAERANAEGLANVRTVLGEDRSSELAPGSVDVVFHSDVYHHFEYPAAMNRSLFQALRPGGRLYVLDFERIEGVGSPRRLEHVRAPKEVVIEEVEAAGFEFVREIELAELEENYLLQFARPNAR